MMNDREPIIGADVAEALAKALMPFDLSLTGMSIAYGPKGITVAAKAATPEELTLDLFAS